MKLRRLFRSIRVRLTLWYVLLLALVLVAFSGAIYLTLRAALYHNLDNALRNSAALLVNALVEDEGRLTVASEQPVVWNNPQAGEHFWRVLDPAGGVIAQSGLREMGDVPVDTAAVATALAGGDSLETVRSGDGLIRVYTTPVDHAGRVVGVVQIGFSLDAVQETLAALLAILSVTLPATLAIASLGGLLLAGRALRPVDHITRAAQAISAGDLSRRLNLDLPDDELGRLARTFDEMIARLDEAFQRQRRFTANASHELRTPLTVIKGTLSLALARPREAHEYRQVLAGVDEEVDRMDRLVERLLILARADARALPLHRQSVNLSHLLLEMVEQMRPLAEAKGLELSAHIASDLEAWVDADAITEVVLNLLDNALKYTPSPGRIRLSANREEEGIRIAVSDSGPGIPAEHLPHLFEPFYRVDRARSRELGGMGLGLTIAHELVRAHGGHLTVHSVPGEGSTFSVHVPDKGRRGNHF